jgi:hypothetical protein
MSNSVKWLLAILLAAALFLIGILAARLVDLLFRSPGWLVLTPIGIIVFILTVIVVRNHVVN